MPIKFTISEEELAKALDISHQKLLDIIEFFDSDPDDEWDLVEGKDYIVIRPSLGMKKFSDKGALEIAYYLDAHGSLGFVHRIKDFITQNSNRLKHALAQRIIQEEFSEPQDKIVQVNGRNFVHKQCLRRILETNGQTIKRTLEYLRQNSPLEIDIDYVERNFHNPKKQKQGQQLWFSGKGCVIVSREISQTLKDKARRSKCRTITVEIEKALQALDNDTKNISRKIENAKIRAKKRNKKTCQIKLIKPNSINQMILTAHHLYSVKGYPHLASVVDNLITIDSIIHQEFHSWMGGFDQPCTVQDFIDFVVERYPEHANETLMQRLYQVKNILKVEVAK
ncbi:hypothetical protein [Synechocystis salina]|uniref:Uncharacterized protein n=1 Tax=Synechocystis salina LEGE 00031 TaxID=1828736 RepID=A0ABR9VNE7_9SYNC|nr:hypothetical protein [Synechocystis salina]MBE9240438.1 hypothetical protein [Synechocystis salina LEGE 00041]MBE9252860.1 hypothetical protein [Synechocystis salina LEGE 00031]